VLLAGCLGFIAPWVITHRDSYIYHFLPAYVAIIMLLSGYVDWLRKRKPVDAMIFVGVVLVVAAFYAPIWSSMETSEAAVNARLFWGAWR
jgi:dolichyl-phosphate-mannose--protein O-mannosyl transferase